MKLSQGHHLAYCTNVHRGNSWAETFSSLENDVMEVRKKICPDEPYAIGLRLGADVARELSNSETLGKFKNGWRKRMPTSLPSTDFLMEIFMGSGSGTSLPTGLDQP